ncbi:hypothetical protein F5882DRAFT_446440 [Hyaloscypha sp. PMI_1271]|nr:hypothetical protein F5882DRAFT_446440 [Hyaloscypha sp. PMI_1271]
MSTSNPLASTGNSSLTEPFNQRSSDKQHLDTYQQRFLKQAHQLFSLDIDNVETLTISKDTGEVTQRFSVDKDAIKEIVEGFNEMASRRKRVPTSFSTFGFKRDDDHRVWDASYGSGPEAGKTSPLIELCYNIRYVERNDRSPKNPWSLRQAGIYQQVIPDQQKSIWILLQPYLNLYDNLKEKLDERSTNGETPIHSSHLLHLDFLFSTASNWGEYIEYLWTVIDTLDDKACNSDIQLGKANDYIISFSDCQKLQRRRRILLRTICVLDSCLALSTHLELHHRKLKASRIIEDDRFLDGIRMYTAQIQMHQRNMRFMIEYIRGTADMLSYILNSRSDETSLKTSQAMEASLALGQKDSQILKALSLIATVYLPASFVALIHVPPQALFSSNIIQFKTSSVGRGHFELVPEFWLYILVTLVLAALTFLLAFLVLTRKLSCCMKRHGIV